MENQSQLEYENRSRRYRFAITLTSVLVGAFAWGSIGWMLAPSTGIELWTARVVLTMGGSMIGAGLGLVVAVILITLIMIGEELWQK